MINFAKLPNEDLFSRTVFLLRLFFFVRCQDSCITLTSKKSKFQFSNLKIYT